MSVTIDPGLLLSAPNDEIWWDEAKQSHVMRALLDDCKYVMKLPAAALIEKMKPGTLPKTEAETITYFRKAFQKCVTTIEDAKKVLADIEAYYALAYRVNIPKPEEIQKHNCDDCPQQGDCTLESWMRRAKAELKH